jgi:hypothetical protein
MNCEEDMAKAHPASYLLPLYIELCRSDFIMIQEWRWLLENVDR